jgi:hypothetical protein
MAHSVIEAADQLSGDDRRLVLGRLSPARLSLLLSLTRRALARLLPVLLTVADRLPEQLTLAAPRPCQLTPDHIPVGDLSPTVPVLRARTTLTAGPPRPLATVGTTG